MKPIIIDAHCGAGKTTWAIEKMKNEADASFVFCTPFLEEIERVRTACGKQRVAEPHNYNMSKTQDFNKLLAAGENIAVTHTTFLNATPETLELIKEGEYILILDEAMDAVVEFNKTMMVKNSPEQFVGEGDLRLLKNERLIEIEENGRVRWIGYNYDDSKYSVFQGLAELDRIYLARNEMILCMFPPEVFRAFSQVYIMTYLFEGSLMKLYFDLFGIEYDYASIKHEENRFVLSEYNPEEDRMFRQNCREKIELCESEALNKGYRQNAFSKNWFKNNINKKIVITRIKNNLRHFFSNIAKARAIDEAIMWTCQEQFKKKIAGKGYTQAKSLTRSELCLSDEEQKKLQKRADCFVPLNAKATNDYRKRWALAYCANMYMQPLMLGFFEDSGIKVNEELYAVSCLIQWIFRSRIRDGENIKLYLPSPRMRKLFVRWLDGKDLPPSLEGGVPNEGE